MYVWLLVYYKNQVKLISNEILYSTFRVDWNRSSGHPNTCSYLSKMYFYYKLNSARTCRRCSTRPGHCLTGKKIFPVNKNLIGTRILLTFCFIWNSKTRRGVRVRVDGNEKNKRRWRTEPYRNWHVKHLRVGRKTKVVKRLQINYYVRNR